MSNIYNWSTNSPANSMSDEHINWKEGQSPKTVTPSARIMLTRFREYIFDIGTVYSDVVIVNIFTEIHLFPSSDITDKNEGVLFRFIANRDGFGSVYMTIAPNIKKQQLFKIKDEGIEPVVGEDIVAGHHYNILLYDDTAILFTGGVKRGHVEEYQIDMTGFLPTGSILIFAGKEFPKGWLACDGSLYRKSDYPALAEALGTKWLYPEDSPADPQFQTHFRVPSLLSRFLLYQPEVPESPYLKEIPPSHRHPVVFRYLKDTKLHYDSDKWGWMWDIVVDSGTPRKTPDSPAIGQLGDSALPKRINVLYGVKT